MDGLHEQARQGEPRTLSGEGGWSEPGWGRQCPLSFLPFGWGCPGPNPTSSVLVPPPWHLAAIMGEQIAAPLPLSGKQAQLGPATSAASAHGTQLGVPRAMLPKNTKRAGTPGEPGPLR